MEETIIIAFNSEGMKDDAIEYILEAIGKQVNSFELIQVLMLPKNEFSAYIESSLKRLDFSTIVQPKDKRIH